MMMNSSVERERQLARLVREINEPKFKIPGMEYVEGSLSKFDYTVKDPRGNLFIYVSGEDPFYISKYVISRSEHYEAQSLPEKSPWTNIDAFAALAKASKLGGTLPNKWQLERARKYLRTEPGIKLWLNSESGFWVAECDYNDHEETEPTYLCCYDYNKGWDDIGFRVVLDKYHCMINR